MTKTRTIPAQFIVLVETTTESVEVNTIPHHPNDPPTFATIVQGGTLDPILHIPFRDIEHDRSILIWVKQFVIDFDVLSVEEEAQNGNLQVGVHEHFNGISAETGLLNGEHLLLGHDALAKGEGVLGHEGGARVAEAGDVVGGGGREGGDGVVAGA